MTDSHHHPAHSVYDPFSIAAVLKKAGRDLRRAWGPLVAFEAGFKLFEAWLFLPGVAFVLSTVLAKAGRVAVSNRDIVDFILTPLGLLYATLFSVLAVALLLFEQAGIMMIAAVTESQQRRSITKILALALLNAIRVARLGAAKVILLTLTFAPFVILAFITYFAFLSRHDINFYLAVRPPSFWLALGIGGVIALAAAVVGMWLFVRWAFALPIVLFERRVARQALRISGERVHGSVWRIGAILLGWQLAGLVLGFVIEASFRGIAGFALERAGDQPIGLILFLLLARGGLLAALSFVVVVGQALITRRLYLTRNEQLGIVHAAMPETTVEPRPTSPWVRSAAYVCIAAMLLAPAPLWFRLPEQLAELRLVQVTAHRGHSHAAPENTLSAIRKAIESGADYAEIDVQQTADGVVVLLHDTDLKRVAGVARPLSAVPYEEVRQLDVGSWFGPAFAGERIPTLSEAIELARGRIKLNIELKANGPDRVLAQESARLVHEHGFESDCLVTTFNYDTLREVERQNPRLRTGLIVAQAIGDVGRLEIDALSVRADALSDEMLRSARNHGKEVHVWTVNDPRQMTRLMERGVDNIITDDPDLLIRVRTEWADMSGSERLLLAARLLLGLNP